MLRGLRLQAAKELNEEVEQRELLKSHVQVRAGPMLTAPLIEGAALQHSIVEL